MIQKLFKPLATAFLTLAILLVTATSFAQDAADAVDDKEKKPSMPWQYGGMFIVHWVMTGVAVTIASKSARRSEKPKKTAYE